MKKKKDTTSNNRKWILIFWGLILFTLLSFYLLMWAAKVGVYPFEPMPDITELENPKSNLASEIISADGKVIGKYFKQNRTNVRFEDLSPHLVDALIATEDERYRDHSGIDFRGLVRAVLKLGRNGGASTITQQLAKMMFHKRESATLSKKIKQKLQEQIIAVELEKRYTKDELIVMYYNRFDFIYNAVGIRSAAQVYFNKRPIELSLEESAVLVGMAKNPSLYNPKRFPENAMKRREVVMFQMKKAGIIDQVQYDSLRVKPIVLDYKKVGHKEGIAPYFRETLRGKLSKLLASKDEKGNLIYAKKDGKPYSIYRDGLKIYTTIDSRMQKHAEWAVNEYIANNLQKQFSKYLTRVRDTRYPYDGGKHGISKETYALLMQSAIKRSSRYRIMAGKECFNCGRRGEKNIKKEGLFYVCQNDDCGKNRPVMSTDSIDIVFNTPIKMELFSHQGPIDTIMTPLDSLKYYKTFLHTGLMSVDPHTGYIKAWVGGVNYQNFAYDHVTSKRQVGSTFKPFVYSTAIQNGYSPCYEVTDVPYTFHKGTFGLDKDWTPTNSGGSSGCKVSLKYALANSMNTITAWTMKQFGEGAPEAIIKQARAMGITSHLDPVPSLCLGVADISLLEMVGANATMVNKGVWIEPTMYTRVEDKFGNVIIDVHPKTNEAMSEGVAYAMLDLMRGVADGEYNKCVADERRSRGKVGYDNIGTAMRLRGSISKSRPYVGHHYPIAAKTGTTQNNSDGWFMGLTPDLVTGVWVGADERAVRFSSTTLGQGANTALPVWGYYMQKVKGDATLDYPDKDFEKPEKGLSIELNCDSYKITTGGSNPYSEDAWN